MLEAKALIDGDNPLGVQDITTIYRIPCLKNNTH